MKRERANLPESIRQRLRNISREQGMPPDALLQFHAMERFLYRLGRSRHADRFVLKGALLLMAWHIEHMRPTRDIDLLGFTENSLENLSRIFCDICQALPSDDDGWMFDHSALRTERIREDADYEGVRVTFPAYLGETRIRMQVDVGFNDVILPSAQSVAYPVLLNDPAPVLKGYTAESVVAEKFEAMVKLGSINSRMKDFFDIWLLMQQCSFNGSSLSRAIRATFERRGTLLTGLPITLDRAFPGMEEKQVQWTAFLRKSRVDYAPLQFLNIAASIAGFVGPFVDALMLGSELNAKWNAGGPWVFGESNTQQ